MKLTRLKHFVVLAAILSGSSWTAADEKQQEEFFEKHVRPVLLDRCIECHGPQKQESDLRLDRRDDVLKAVVSDVALISAGHPDSSRLIQVIRHAEDDTQMPPSSKLPDEQIAALRQWIADGAFWPQHADLEADAIRRAERWRDHWAFSKPVMPDLSKPGEGSNPIDFFIHE